jgi:uncharacterized protein
MFNRIAGSPILVRVIPFAAFAALTMFQGRFGDASQYWIYALKTAIGAWLLWLVRPYVKEMRWTISWEAVAAGIAVFAAWVGLDGLYPTLDEIFAYFINHIYALIGMKAHYATLVARTESFNPLHTFGSGSALATICIAVRLIGASLIVPPLEEMFYRSFIYRYIIKPDFSEIPLGYLNWRAFLITGAAFGLSHYEWLPGILCAFIYQGLVCRKNRLGDAITAHAITNFLLAIWVITRNAYYFW